MRPFHLWNSLFEKRFVFLTIFAFLFIVLPPFLYNYPFLGLITVGLYTLILAFCLVIITGHDKPKAFHIIFLILLVLPFLQIDFLYYETGLYLIIGLIYGWAAFKIVFQILKIENVSSEVIMGAVGGYLLIGLSGSFFVAFFAEVQPMAFSPSPESGALYRQVYFTFVTLTTLGYGDITPKNPQAQSISILIALVGQIYLTILMAILVGKYLNNSRTSRNT